jgi:hypothetical protein
MNKWRKTIRIMLLAAAGCLAGSLAYAAPASLPDADAMQKARVSYAMTGTDGSTSNVYIIGENESFTGAGNTTWRTGEWDQIYSASRYNAYVSPINSDYAVLQDASLFTSLYGSSPGTYRFNLTDPSYSGGAFLIEGVNGQPDILVTAKQESAGGVSYRFFVIRNGKLTPMKIMFENRQTAYNMTGTHHRPYGLADGTVAVPWFKQRTMDSPSHGSFITVFMPDFTNAILTSAYVVKE